MVVIAISPSASRRKVAASWLRAVSGIPSGSLPPFAAKVGGAADVPGRPESAPTQDPMAGSGLTLAAPDIRPKFPQDYRDPDEPGRCHGPDCSVNGDARVVRRRSFPDMVSRHSDLRGPVRRRAAWLCRGNARFPTPTDAKSVPHPHRLVVAGGQCSVFTQSPRRTQECPLVVVGEQVERHRLRSACPRTHHGGELCSHGRGPGLASGRCRA